MYLFKITSELREYVILDTATVLDTATSDETVFGCTQNVPDKLFYSIFVAGWAMQQIYTIMWNFWKVWGRN